MHAELSPELAASLEVTGFHLESDSEETPHSRTDVRHLRLVVDELKNAQMFVPAEEVMRAVYEIEQLRPAREQQIDALQLLRVAMSAVDKAEATLSSKLIAWQATDLRLLSKEQRMERMDWEAEKRRDVEYSRRRLFAAVRTLLSDNVPDAAMADDARARHMSQCENWLDKMIDKAKG